MRVLIWGIAPWAHTGYGTGSRYLARTLKSLGHDVAIWAFRGCTDGDTSYDGIPVMGNPVPSRQVYVVEAARRWRADVVIAWFDLWNIVGQLHEITSKLPHLILYGPLDSAPLSGYQELAIKSGGLVVPMCQWAHNIFKNSHVGNLADPIYHGVDTEIFKPLPVAESQGHDFTFLTVKVNYAERNNYPGMLRAFRRVLEKYPDVRYKIWAYPYMDDLNHEGYDLEGIWDSLDGPKEALLTADPMQYLTGLSDQAMAQMYGAADCLVNATFGEGFGFPIIESMACSRPVVGTDWSAMTEIVGRDNERGVLVDRGSWWNLQASYSWQVIPDENSLVNRMCTMVEMLPEFRRQMGENAREWVIANCDWQIIGKQWHKLLTNL